MGTRDNANMVHGRDAKPTNIAFQEVSEAELDHIHGEEVGQAPLRGSLCVSAPVIFQGAEQSSLYFWVILCFGRTMLSLLLRWRFRIKVMSRKNLCNDLEDTGHTSMSVSAIPLTSSTPSSYSSALSAISVLPPSTRNVDRDFQREALQPVTPVLGPTDVALGRDPLLRLIEGHSLVDPKTMDTPAGIYHGKPTSLFPSNRDLSSEHCDGLEQRQSMDIQYYDFEGRVRSEPGTPSRFWPEPVPSEVATSAREVEDEIMSNQEESDEDTMFGEVENTEMDGGGSGPAVT